MKKSRYQKNVYNSFFVFLIFITFGSLLITYDQMNNLIFSYIIIIFGIIFLIEYLLSYKIYKKKISIYDYFIILLIIFGIIATIFAINSKVSLLGFQNRNEGLLVICCYYIIFLLSRTITEKKYLEKITNTISIIGVIEVLFGILQMISFWTNLFQIPYATYYASGFLGNSNFFATFMVICYALNLGLWYYKSNKYYLIMIIIFSIGVIISGAMSAYLAIIVLYLLLLASNIKLFIAKDKLNFKKNIKKMILGVIILFGFYLLIANTLITTLNKDVLNFGDDTKNVITNNISNSSGNSRIYLWEKILQYVPKNIVNGIGIDNLYYINNGYPIMNLKTDESFDKAHNEYLQLLITQGIFAFWLYITLFIYVFVNNIKSLKSRNYKYPFMLVFICYSIQAFFNISITRVAPIFFLILGLLAADDKESTYEK